MNRSVYSPVGDDTSLKEQKHQKLRFLVDPVADPSGPTCSRLIQAVLQVWSCMTAAHLGHSDKLWSPPVSYIHFKGTANIF